MLQLYVPGTSSKMSENTKMPLQSLVVYELNQKVIGHIGVKQLQKTLFSVKAKESIFFFGPKIKFWSLIHPAVTFNNNITLRISEWILMVEDWQGYFQRCNFYIFRRFKYMKILVDQEPIGLPRGPKVLNSG